MQTNLIRVKNVRLTMAPRRNNLRIFFNSTAVLNLGLGWLTYFDIFGDTRFPRQVSFIAGRQNK